MARIAGVDLPNDKRLDIALTYLYGVGRSNILVPEKCDHADRLYGGKRYRNKSRILINFFASVLAFFLQFLKLRKNDRQKLQDNGCVDVRIQAQRHDRKINQRPS